MSRQDYCYYCSVPTNRMGVGPNGFRMVICEPCQRDEVWLIPNKKASLPEDDKPAYIARAQRMPE